MNYLHTIANFLKGTYAKFGTTANLLREISLSVLTAAAVAIIVQLLQPKNADPVSELKAVMETVMVAQRRNDEARFNIERGRYRKQIDSLSLVIQLDHEQDSIRSNGHQSALDAIRSINNALNRSGRGQ